MRFSAVTAIPALAASLLLAVAGCARNEAAPAVAAAAPGVDVAQVLQRPVTEYDEFTGRFVAVDRVAVRPRVSGYVTRVVFEPGHEVRKGDILFTIDARPYEAELKRTRAELERARTQLTLARSERERAVKLLKLRAISREEFDSRTAASEQASANVDAASAAVDTAALNLSFTKVRSPIAGLASREEITAGNFVASGQTLLTTVVSVDKIYVEFEGNEALYLKYAALARAGKIDGPRDGNNSIWVGLADETGTPHEGKLVFMDNALDPQTGTIRARGLLDNSDRRFTPGLFARVKIAASGRHDALLVRDSAIGTDQNLRYVLAVGEDHKLQYRAVTLGPVVNGLRVVREGLEAGEYIVVNGLQRVRPGAVIIPQRVAMEPKPAAAPGMLAYTRRTPR